MKTIAKRFLPAAVTVLALAAFLSGCCARKGGCPFSGSTDAGSDAAPADETEVSADVLETLLASGASVTVLDARTGKYDDGRRIPGAKSLSAKSTEQEAAAVVQSKDALVVTYCSNLKCPASRMLAARLKELGYKNVLEYPEGIDGWAAAGKEVKKAK